MSELTFNEEKFQEMMNRLCEAIPDEVSSIEELSLYYDIFKKGYQYAVEKAVEFLKEKEFGDWIEQEASSFIEDFRKFMEE